MPLVPLDTNLEEAEITATKLLQYLLLLSPSPECEAAIRPFLCLYMFGSCDSVNNQPHQVAQTDCVSVRDDACAHEWVLVERFLGQGILPECSKLPSQAEGDECHGKP